MKVSKIVLQTYFLISLYYRETSMRISCIVLYYCDSLIFYITVILYLFAGGYKCHLTTFPTRFAHDVSIL